MPIHADFFVRAILTRKVGQTDLVFGMQSGIISRSVHARLQGSVCSGYNLFHPSWHPDRHTQTAFWPAYMKSSDSWTDKNVNSSCRLIPDGEFRDADRKTRSSLLLMSWIAFCRRSMFTAEDGDLVSVKPRWLSRLCIPTSINRIIGTIGCYILTL